MAGMHSLMRLVRGVGLREERMVFAASDRSVSPERLPNLPDELKLFSFDEFIGVELNFRRQLSKLFISPRRCNHGSHKKLTSCLRSLPSLLSAITYPLRFSLLSTLSVEVLETRPVRYIIMNIMS
ncbi:hypothetical protein KC19_1G027300 [Ceratodon purpureus]|uniref:Uncharacterized protein n=1 Tax=Ceratodon purpureus TaxID=3225 RepID=A0A8T0J0P7_CERPU|nr:hypothetical protein KC19_1G027300 [Ceratodon purpureus]